MLQLFSCYASAAFGLEGLVAGELRSLYMQEVKAENGGVRFVADADGLMRCNLNMRTCDRIYIVAAQGTCLSFEELYQLVLSVEWQEYLEGSEAINVSARCARSRLMSPRDCQSVTKKAIIEKLRKATKQSVFPENGAAFPIQISVHSDLVRILINTSGEALSRRGYRTWNGEAPIRETLAAALVELSPWKPGRPLYDPCCGTGTILIEAALIASGRAPGLHREFAMEHLAAFREVQAEQIRKKTEEISAPASELMIRGSDISADAVDLAVRHVRQAHVCDLVKVSVKPLQEVSLEETGGVFICNPPYGERLSDQKNCRKLYGDLAGLWKRHPSWSICVISSDPSFERAFGKKADKKRRLYNGRLECTYYIYC